MITQQATTRDKLAGGLLLGAVASGLAAAALSGTGTAMASCASISGISTGSSGGSVCTSTPTSFAIGVGDKTTAAATGLFNGAIAIGTNNGPTNATAAVATGALSLAYANGKNTSASTEGNLSLAVAQGDNLEAQAGLTPGDIGNVAINVAQGETVIGGNSVLAAGQGNLAANLGGVSGIITSYVQAYGTGNAAVNIGGKGNVVSAGNVNGNPPFVGVPLNTKSVAALAFQAGGSNNVVTAVGPLAVAGALGKDNLTGANKVLQVGPGININGTKFP